MAGRQNIREGEYLKGLNDVAGNIQEAVDNMIDGSVRGLADALMYVASESQQRVPVDTGDLRGSVEVKIDGSVYARGQNGGGLAINGSIPQADTDRVVGEVSYNTKYAANQHEHTEYSHPKGGQAKYLESVLIEKKDDILNLIAGGVINETMQ